MRTVLVDTSAFVALVSQDDAAHAAASKTMAMLADEGAALYTTNFLVAETYTLLLRRSGADAARAWLKALKIPVVRVLSEDQQRAEEILTTPFVHSISPQFHAYSYFDASSFAVMERLETKDAFAFDRHFRLAGFNVLGL